MKTAVEPVLKSKTYFNNKHSISLREKETGVGDLKFYQKLFVVLIALSTILIFPESPRELEKICESYNSRKLCIVW